MVSVNAITSGIKTVYRYGKRLLNVAPELAFGTASEATGAAMRQQKVQSFKRQKPVGEH